MSGFYCNIDCVIRYPACIRQEAGYCCVEYHPCEDQTDAFTLHANDATAKVDTQCVSLDYITIEGKPIKRQVCSDTITIFLIQSQKLFLNQSDINLVSNHSRLQATPFWYIQHCNPVSLTNSKIVWCIHWNSNNSKNFSINLPF